MNEHDKHDEGVVADPTDDLFLPPDDDDEETPEQAAGDAQRAEEEEEEEEGELTEAVEAKEEDAAPAEEQDQQEAVDQAGAGPEESLSVDGFGGGGDTSVEAVLDTAEQMGDLEQLRGERDELQQRVAELEAERDDIKNRMLRVAADLENYRRRTQREHADLQKYGISGLVKDLIPQLDNLERALQHVEGGGEPKSVIDGVQMVYRGLLSAMEKHGVTSFDSLHQPFDPQRHEALQQVESEEHPTNTVVNEFQKGYFVHDRLLRPALVAVAKFIGAEAPAAPQKPQAAGEEEQPPPKDTDGSVGDSAEQEQQGPAGQEQGQEAQAPRGEEQGGGEEEEEENTQER